MNGIYAIRNIINKKVYIGQSNDIEKRFSNHKYELRNNIHFNQHLQKAWNKYGETAFEFFILEECSLDKLDEKEIYYILLYNSYRQGYNRTTGGVGNYKISQYCPICGNKTKWGRRYCPNHQYKRQSCGKRCGDDEVHRIFQKLKPICQDCRSKSAEKIKLYFEQLFEKRD